MKRSGFSRIRIRNYQSLVDVDIPLGPLTVCVGDNAAGKSAILRAIKAACFNATGTDFITHGAAKTEVELTLDDGPTELPRTLLWRKKREGGATYDLQDDHGEILHFSKLGSAVPPEIEAALAMREIEVDKTLTIRPQIHEQGEYAFLIDRSEGQAARALAKMTKLDVVVEAQGLIRTDLRRAKADAKATTDLLTDLERQSKEFVGLEDEVALCERVTGEVSDAASLYLLSHDRVLALDKYDHAVASLVDVPDVDTAVLTQGYNVVLTQRVALNAYGLAKDRLAALPETLPEVPDLADRLSQLASQRAAFEHARAADFALVDILEELGVIEDAHRHLVVAYNALNTCPECQQVLPTLVAV